MRVEKVILKKLHNLCKLHKTNESKLNITNLHIDNKVNLKFS